MVNVALVTFEGDKPTRRGASEFLARVDSGLVDVRAVHVIGRPPTDRRTAWRCPTRRPRRPAWRARRGALSVWRATRMSPQRPRRWSPAASPSSSSTENPGSIPFVGAPWMSGGRLVASTRLAADAASGASDTNVPAPDAAGE